MEGIIAIIMVFSIPLVAIIGGMLVASKKNQLKYGSPSINETALKKQIGNLMAENEAIKDRLENLEYLLLKDNKNNIDTKTKIELTDYEKEQIRLDKRKDWEY